VKTKALLLGALPGAFIGPWVDLPEGGEWDVQPRADYGGFVVVEVDAPAGPRFKIDGEPVRIRGLRARGIVLAQAKELDVDSITVQLRQVV